MKHSQADVERAKADLGYRPTTDMREGLRRCLEWWRDRTDGTPALRFAALV